MVCRSFDDGHSDSCEVRSHYSFDLHFSNKDGEALYSQQKQDQELTVAQTMNSLLPNSDLN